jgi:hypothetical protein
MSSINNDWNTVALVQKGPCEGCMYKSHCSGQRDRITSVVGYKDTCVVVDRYEQLRPIPADAERVPHRVAAMHSLWNTSNTNDLEIRARA